MEYSSIRTAAEAYHSSVVTQQALGVMGMINLVSWLGTTDRCVANNTNYDYIIIGGGTSGCVIANRLSKNSEVKVLLIEAGGDIQIENTLPGLNLYNKRSRLDWNYTAEYDYNYVVGHQSGEYYPTLGKVLGGTSSVDYLQYSQGEDREYDNAAYFTGEPAWQSDNILRLFRKLERFNVDVFKNSPNSPNKIYHGFKGNVGITKDDSPVNYKYLEAFRTVGHEIVDDINSINRLGYTGSTYYLDKYIKQNSAFAYLFPVKNRSNLVVLKNTQVNKILFDKNKHAVGVEVIDLETESTHVYKARREIILTAGTFNTPKLLQLSGIGPKNVLQKLGIPVIVDFPEVGANYQNHMAIPLVYVTEKTCQTYDSSTYDPHKSSIASFVGHVALNKHNTYADYRTVNYVIPFSPAITTLQYGAFILRLKYEIVDYWISHSVGREMLFTYLQNSKPKSRGRVQIRSNNPKDQPIIKAPLFTNDLDIQDMINYANHHRKIMNSPYFKKVGAMFVDPTEETCGRFPAYSEGYWRCYINTLMLPMGHHVGTASLGVVVDGRLRVYGVKGLRVADSSIIPELCAGSMIVPTMMIGENAAEMIQEDWKQKKKPFS